MSLTEYILGNLVRVTGTFTDEDGVLHDAPEVKFELRTPDGKVTLYVYGTDTEVVKDGVGIYHVDISLDSYGEYKYYFYSEGLGQAANQGAFSVTNKYTIPSTV
jgi:hypothetical protein